MTFSKCKVTPSKCTVFIQNLELSLKKSFVHFTDETTGKSMKKPKRSPFNIFRRGKDDKNNNSSPVGKLFGRPLGDMVTADGLPKAVMVRKK